MFSFCSLSNTLYLWEQRKIIICKYDTSLLGWISDKLMRMKFYVPAALILPTNAIFYVHAFGSSWKTTYKHLVWSTAMKFWRNCRNSHHATRQLIFASTAILLSQPENQLLLTPFPVSLSTFLLKEDRYVALLKANLPKFSQ